MECIKDILRTNNWKIVQSPGDVHCLVYSIISSWNNQLYNYITDVIPSVISNILNMSLKIINEHNNTACDVIDIHLECTYNGILVITTMGYRVFLVLVLTRIIHTRTMNLNSLITSRVCPEEYEKH